MNLTKSVRDLAADINAAPDNYDSNDEVSEKCLSVEAEFEAPEFSLPRRMDGREDAHEGEGATDGREDADEGEGAAEGREDAAFPLATSGRRLG